MNPEVVITFPAPPGAMGVLEREFTLYKLWESEDPAALLRSASGVRALVTNAVDGASAELIDALPNLGLIASLGVGTDALDLGHAADRGVRVSTTPDVLTEDVAELAFALMLSVARRVAEGDRYVRHGRWEERPMGLGRRVNGRRLGVLGMGRIGQALARRASGFDMAIAYHQRHRNDALPYRYHEDLESLARHSDFLVVIVPGGTETRNMVDARILDALGPEGVLINVGRGSVVDEDALVTALEDGRLGGAGLDVFAREPHVPTALRTMDNVVLVPHIGSATVETREAMGQLVIDNLRAFFAGRPLPTPVV